MKIKKVVIWGHKGHKHTLEYIYGHTHSYIHYAFFKAFKHLGYETYWLDNEDDVSSFDFNETFVLTGTNVDTVARLPIHDNCFYFCHNFPTNWHEGQIADSKILRFYVHGQAPIRGNPNMMADKEYPYHYYCDASPDGKEIVLLWGTDLLPHEIEHNIAELGSVKPEEDCLYFVGTLSQPWVRLRRTCVKYEINYINKRSIGHDEHQALIKRSLIAPALQFYEQVKTGYIPCRVFKNISYGRMPATNNVYVNQLFDNRLVYHEIYDALLRNAVDVLWPLRTKPRDMVQVARYTDKLFFWRSTSLQRSVEKLFLKAREFEKRSDKNKIVKELMLEVKEKHTYLSRIEFIRKHMLRFFDIEL